MSDKLYDFATQKAAISGYFAKDYELTLQWLPQYVEEHLLMCCKPLCNEKSPSRERLWGKAFD